MGENGRTACYLAYRHGAAGDDLPALLRLALADYRQRRGGPPAAVMVHKTIVDEARQALTTLALDALPAAGCGGCLVGEVWLAVDEGGERECR